MNSGHPAPAPLPPINPEVFLQLMGRGVITAACPAQSCSQEGPSRATLRWRRLHTFHGTLFTMNWYCLTHIPGRLVNFTKYMMTEELFAIERRLQQLKDGSRILPVSFIENHFGVSGTTQMTQPGFEAFHSTTISSSSLEAKYIYQNFKVAYFNVASFKSQGFL